MGEILLRATFLSQPAQRMPQITQAVAKANYFDKHDQKLRGEITGLLDVLVTLGHANWGTLASPEGLPTRQEEGTPNTMLFSNGVRLCRYFIE